MVSSYVYADGLTTNYSPDEILFTSSDGTLAVVYRVSLKKAQIIEGACFPANTPIQTQNGTKAIQDIAVGDLVIAYDEIQKDTILARVKQTFSKSWQKMIRLVAGNDTITATSNHPFYLPQLSRYMPADSLRRGIQVLALAGTLLTVQSAMAFDSSMTVYNFEVEEYHNYFVGDEGILVHNSCVFRRAGIIGDNADGSVFNRFEEAFPDNPQRELLKLALENDLADASDDLLDFFRVPNHVAPPSLAEVQVSRVRAWEVVSGSNFSSDISTLRKIDEHLSHFDGDALIQRRQNLKAAFANAANQADFIDGFIGGPLLKNELEELNNLYYKQANTYEVGSGGYVLTPAEASRVDDLEIQLGSYEHPNTLTTDSPQFIGNTSTAPQPAPDNFWADVKVANGKIEGLIPNKKYDYVITYPFDGSPPQLRLGLGHYRISGSAPAVKGADSLKFNSEGKIYEINRQSGHYISIPQSNLAGELDETVNILNSNGLTTPDIYIYIL